MRCIVRLVALVLVLLTFGITRQASAEPRQDQCVILVSVDGLAGFYVDDPRAQMPTLRKMAREGARAQGMVCAFPSVTWPAHAVLSTGACPGKNGMIGNSYLDRTTRKSVTLLCDPVFDKDEILKVPTIYDAAHQAGLKTAGVLWPATRNATSLDWSVPDMPGDDTWEQLGTKSWLAEMRKAGIPVDRHGPWCRETSGGVQRDWLYTRMADHVLREHAPNLLMIHLVEPDHVQHRCGPRSDEAYWCASYTDDRIRDLVESVERSPHAGKTTFVVVGDHGFFPVRNDIRPNVLLRKLGLIEVSGGKVQKQDAWCLSQGGACAVYIWDDARRAEITAKLRDELKNVEGIQAVFTADQFAQLGQSTPDKDPRAPDLWLAAKSDYAFSEAYQGEEATAKRPTLTGTHGYLPDQPDMLSACVIWGPGIKPGTNLGKIDQRDIAPTIAQLLGISLPTAEGKVLPVQK
jgi:predicted AlkP superfamily pyrophosphatase or phosphodiesterase